MPKLTEVMIHYSQIQDRHVSVGLQEKSVDGNYGNPQGSKGKAHLPIAQTGYA